MKAALLSNIILLITATIFGWSGGHRLHRLSGVARLGDRASMVRFISGAPMSGMPSEGLKEFDALIAEVMAEWQIPGLAMATVRKNEPPLLR
jgi:hypothetical protein